MQEGVLYTFIFRYITVLRHFGMSDRIRMGYSELFVRQYSKYCYRYYSRCTHTLLHYFYCGVSELSFLVRH